MIKIIDVFGNRFFYRVTPGGTIQESTCGRFWGKSYAFPGKRFNMTKQTVRRTEEKFSAQLISTGEVPGFQGSKITVASITRIPRTSFAVGLVSRKWRRD